MIIATVIYLAHQLYIFQGLKVRQSVQSGEQPHHSY